MNESVKMSSPVSVRIGHVKLKSSAWRSGQLWFDYRVQLQFKIKCVGSVQATIEGSLYKFRVHERVDVAAYIT